MDTSAFLEYLRQQDWYFNQITHIEQLTPRPARFGELDRPLVTRLELCLIGQGLSRLYTHQSTSVNYARQGSNVMVATASASGKSLCYHIPVMEKLLTDKNSRALYLFPTKALAHDQLRSLAELFNPEIVKPGDYATFDGDTSLEDRAEVKKSARLILTNPDMLHVGIIPNHQSWLKLFHNLRYVIIDEAHIYRGVFGSHVANVIRRLRRVCSLYGSSPQFILCSATIANPGEHAEKLVGLPFKVVDNDGSPRGKKEFIFWNPPLIDPQKGTRKSANSESTNVFTSLIEKAVRTIDFTRTRRLTELIYTYSRNKLSATSETLAKRVQPYRAGYLAEDRRRIERALFNGELLGVVATSALELGIDVGDLDATVLTGYPGSIASTWQQAGRSGRGLEDSLSILIGLDGPLDQYFMRHPEFFFGHKYEYALVNPDNHYILRDHIKCAAWEMPLEDSDDQLFGDGWQKEKLALVDAGQLRERKGRWFLAPSISYPAQEVNIRAATGDNYAIMNAGTGQMLETVDSGMAFFQGHPGAIYLHQGESYLVVKLDSVGHNIFVEPTDARYYTQAREITDLKVKNVLRTRTIGSATVELGEVEVTTTVVGFKKKAQYTEEILGEEPLEMPPQQFNTIALWFDIPPAALAGIAEKELDLAGGLHATEHAAIGLLPLFALCDRNDIGGISTVFHPDTGKAQVFIYDAHPGGIGIAEKGFEIITELWQATAKTIAECPCESGCPSCIQSPKCGNNNKPLDKAAALILLETLLGLPK